MMVDTKESKIMDIKINDIQTSSSVQQVKNTESTDSSFKFTLISNIEERIFRKAWQYDGTDY